MCLLTDSSSIRFQLRHCELVEFGLLTTFSCLHEPTYVLTSACSDEYYFAAGICCKFDESINFVANAFPELFARTKYLIESDDDVYWRVDQLMKWLGAVERAGVSHLPIVANDDNSSAYEMLSTPGGVWHVESGCEEIKTYGWYQPIVLNHAALELIRENTKEFGVTDTCREFNMSQDAGIGIFLWLHSMFHIFLPGFFKNYYPKGMSEFKPKYLSIHGVKHSVGDCDESKWSSEDRRNQAMVVGCGTLHRKAPLHNPSVIADMYDTWNYFSEFGVDLTVGVAGVNDWIRLYANDSLTDFHTTSFVSEGGRELSDNNTSRIVPYIVPFFGYNLTIN